MAEGKGSNLSHVRAKKPDRQEGLVARYAAWSTNGLAQKIAPVVTEPRAIASGIKIQQVMIALPDRVNTEGVIYQISKTQNTPALTMSPDPARYRSRFCTKRVASL
jgi:hypothetical protein